MSSCNADTKNGCVADYYENGHVRIRNHRRPYHRWRASVALQATVENIRDFVWEIYYWDLRTLNNAKPYFFLNEMNKKDLPAMYSTAFWCLFVVLLFFCLYCVTTVTPFIERSSLCQALRSYTGDHYLGAWNRLRTKSLIQSLLYFQRSSVTRHWSPMVCKLHYIVPS